MLYSLLIYSQTHRYICKAWQTDTHLYLWDSTLLLVEVEDRSDVWQICRRPCLLIGPRQRHSDWDGDTAKTVLDITLEETGFSLIYTVERLMVLITGQWQPYQESEFDVSTDFSLLCRQIQTVSGRTQKIHSGWKPCLSHLSISLKSKVECCERKDQLILILIPVPIIITYYNLLTIITAANTGASATSAATTVTTTTSTSAVSNILSY